MRFQIVTPEKVVFADEIDQISVMTEDGEITVLPNHIPLVTSLVPGELKFVKNKEEKVVAVAGGFCVVRDDGSVVIMADAAERPEEIDITRAETAKAKAEALMKESKEIDSAEYATLQATLERSLNRLRIGNKYRKLPRP